MTNAQRWWLITWLCAMAGGLLLYFVENHSGYTRAQQDLFGVLVPAVLFMAAGYLVFGRKAKAPHVDGGSVSASGARRASDWSWELKPRPKWPFWLLVLWLPILALIDYGLVVTLLSSPWPERLVRVRPNRS
jgi:hypothetical protein